MQGVLHGSGLLSAGLHKNFSDFRWSSISLYMAMKVLVLPKLLQQWTIMIHMQARCEAGLGSSWARACWVRGSSDNRTVFSPRWGDWRLRCGGLARYGDHRRARDTLTGLQPRLSTTYRNIFSHCQVAAAGGPGRAILGPGASPGYF